VVVSTALDNIQRAEYWSPLAGAGKPSDVCDCSPANASAGFGLLHLHGTVFKLGGNSQAFQCVYNGFQCCIAFLEPQRSLLLFLLVYSMDMDNTSMDDSFSTGPTAHSPVDAAIFTPFTWSMKEIKNAIPPHLFVRNTKRGLVYLIRDLILAATLWKAATFIDPCFNQIGATHILKRSVFEALRWAAWLT
jgi:hypothetical protein